MTIEADGLGITSNDRLDRLLWASGSELVPKQARASSLPSNRRHIGVDPENLERGLAQLVLTLIEFLRQLMERQAIRRMTGGSLTDDEIERLGTTFMRLSERMAELRGIFGLEEEDLNLDLGPLGDLM